MSTQWHFSISVATGSSSCMISTSGGYRPTSRACRGLCPKAGSRQQLTKDIQWSGQSSSYCRGGWTWVGGRRSSPLWENQGIGCWVATIGLGPGKWGAGKDAPAWSYSHDLSIICFVWEMRMTSP